MNNMAMLMQAVKNPQQFVQQMMNNSQVMQNPIAKNAIKMMQNGDEKGLEEMGRNLCKERGIDPQDAMDKIKSMFGA